jgi:L-cysteine S-thiosulfotransferase
MTRTSASLMLGLVAVLGVGLAFGQQLEGAREVEGRRSGYLFMNAATQALQDDDFQNPGMFAVDQGEELWAAVDPASGLSCATCHDETEMRSVATRYPRYEASIGGLENLELRINRERAERMGLLPLDYESEDLVALTTFISFQSRGLAMDVAVDGPAAPFFDAGREFYFERRGQLDLSCAQCHDERAGLYLRGDLMSQGQANGFPIWRILWNDMGSRHRMFQWCNTSVRAEPYSLGSPEYLALELYVAWRGRGLEVEAPAVRR